MTQLRIKMFSENIQLEAKTLHHLIEHDYLILISFLVSKTLNHYHCMDHYIIQLTKDFLQAKVFLQLHYHLLLFLHPKLKKHVIWVFHMGITMCDPHHLLYHPQEYFHCFFLYIKDPKGYQL